MDKRMLALSSFAIVLLSMVSVSAYSGRVYWTSLDGDAIQSGDLAGVAIETLVNNGLTAPTAIAIDHGAGKVYWSDFGVSSSMIQDGTIRRANLDGSGAEDVIVSGLIGVKGLAIDEEAGKLYFTEGQSATTIRRANVDGTGQETLAGPFANIRGIALDASAGKLYFCRSNTIDRIDLISLSVEPVFAGSFIPLSMALDVANGKLYWSESNPNRVRRCSLDGTNVELIVEQDPPPSFWTPNALAIDHESQKLYIGTSHFTADPIDEPNTILRSNLDGTQLEIWLASDNVNATGLVADSAAGHLYWTSSIQTWFGQPKVQRGKISGFQVETMVSLDLATTLRRMAIDLPNGKMYWTDVGTDRISRANLDGTEAEDLVVNGLSFPTGLALDAQAGKMYWTDEMTGMLQRSNLDGTNVEDLIYDLVSPRGMAIDPVAGKMYWATAPTTATGKVHRANLDGSDAETLLQNLQNPLGVLIDSAQQDLYVTSGALGGITAGKILRHSLVSSETEIIVSAPAMQLWGALDLALDGHNDRLYWGDIEIGKIQSCRTDGSDLRDILSGLVTPGGIAIDARRAGDFDSSARVTMRDFAAFQTCFTADETTYANFGCFFFDVEPRDTFVDEYDYSSFVPFVGGP